MKKAISCVLVAVSACWVATSQMAQAAELVPWHNDFETNTLNMPLSSSSEFGSWTAADGEVAVVTNLDYSALRQIPMVTYPLTNAATRSQIVFFEGAGLTNEVQGGAYQNVWVDMMIQPTQMETPPVSEAVSNSQMSLFVDTNGFINVYHAALTDNSYSSLTPQWSALDGFPPIGTDKWVRVTVRMDYAISGDTGHSLFQVSANGHLFTNGAAASETDLYTPVRTGTWFVCANSVNAQISAVAFSGKGMIDDLVVATNAVDIQYVESPLLFALPHGTPQPWLAQYTTPEYASYGLSVTNDDTDVDNDGAKEWQEYVAGTIPVNSNSVLKILAGQVANGVGMIVWQSTTNMPDTNAVYYVLQAASNLLDGAWSTISTNSRAEGALTNFGEAIRSPGFFRVSFTNQ